MSTPKKLNPSTSPTKWSSSPERKQPLRTPTPPSTKGIEKKRFSTPTSVVSHATSINPSSVSGGNYSEHHSSLLPGTATTGDKKKKVSKRENVKVFCRIRPLNDEERAKDKSSAIIYNDTSIELRNTHPYKTMHIFNFDGVFGPNATQEEVYHKSTEGVVDDIMSGYHATIFTYGQIDAGKTYTMTGNKSHPGVLQQTVTELFERISEVDPRETEILVKVSFFQIYLDEIKDLLNHETNTKDLKLREDKRYGMMITALTEIVIRSKHELFEVLRKGLRHRELSTFGLHKGCNRSHIVFSITIEQSFFLSSITKISKLTFVDLAGSERITRTPSSDERHVTEAIKINESLAVLIKVIGSLTDESFGGHVPYRESKLTHYLKHSFGGNSKTIFLLGITSTTSSARETLATLRLGMSSKRVENTMSMNEEATIPRESSSSTIYAELQAFIEAQNVTIQALQGQVKHHQAQATREVQLEQLLTKAQKTLEAQSKMITNLHESMKDLRGQLLEKEELLVTVLAREQLLIESSQVVVPLPTNVAATVPSPGLDVTEDQPVTANESEEEKEEIVVEVENVVVEDEEGDGMYEEEDTTEDTQIISSDNISHTDNDEP